MKSGSQWLALFLSIPVAVAVWLATTNRGADDRQSSGRLLPLMTSRQFIQVIPEDQVLKTGWNDRAWRPDLASVIEGPERERARAYLKTLDAKIAVALSTSSNVFGAKEWAERTTIGTVFGAFSDQTANLIHLENPQFDRTVVVNEQAQPFWPAVDAIAAQAGLVVDASLNADQRPKAMFRGVHFRDRTTQDDSLSIAYAGPFRIVAGPAVRESDAVGKRLVRVPLQIHAEPRLIPMRLTWSDDAVTIVCDGDTLPLVTKLPRTMSPDRLAHHVLTTELVCRDVPLRSQMLTLSANFIVALDIRTNMFVGNLSSPSGFLASTSLGYALKPHSLPTFAEETVEVELSIERGNVALPGPLQFHNAELTYDWHAEADVTKVAVVRSDVPTYRKIDDDRGIVAYRFKGVVAEAHLQMIRGNVAHAVVDVPVAFTIADLPIGDANLAPLNAGSGAVP